MTTPIPAHSAPSVRRAASSRCGGNLGGPSKNERRPAPFWLDYERDRMLMEAERMTFPHFNGDIARMTDEQLARLDETPPRRRGQPAAVAVLSFALLIFLALAWAVADRVWHEAAQVEAGE